MELAGLAHPVTGVQHSLAQPHRGRAATADGRALIARTQLQSPGQGTGRLPGEDWRSPTTRWSPLTERVVGRRYRSLVCVGTKITRRPASRRPAVRGARL